MEDLLGSFEGCNVLNIFCPSFCRRKKMKTEAKEKKSEWGLRKDEIKKICKYLKIYDEEGFGAIFPHKLHQQWDKYMLFDLFETWITYIYGNKEDILPDYERFSVLVKGQWAGSVEERARVIFAILSGTKYEDTEDEELKIDKFIIVKYFFELFATCLRGMGLRNNPELLLWMSCDADFNENKLQAAMKFYHEELPDMAGVTHLRKLMNDHHILGDVLKSVIEMCFGIAPFTNRMVPFPVSSSRTILDVAHTVLLNAFIGGGVETYEWQMLYNIRDGCSWTRFEDVLDKGPTVLLLRDRERWVFGGYASESWKLSHKFYGNGRSFLFRLYPVFKVFRPSFDDENFMFLNHLFEHLPLGLGMGGDLEQFGLWVDVDKPIGKCSQSCRTYQDFECLSGTSNFFYTDMEVWRIFPRLFEPPRRRRRLSWADDSSTILQK